MKKNYRQVGGAPAATITISPKVEATPEPEAPKAKKTKKAEPVVEAPVEPVVEETPAVVETPVAEVHSEEVADTTDEA